MLQHPRMVIVLTADTLPRRFWGARSAHGGRVCGAGSGAPFEGKGDAHLQAGVRALLAHVIQIALRHRGVPGLAAEGERHAEVGCVVVVLLL